MQLTDIGANLTSKHFRGDVDGVIARAVAAGVDRMIVTGVSLDASWAARELALRYPARLWSTAGVHPHNARQLGSESLPRLRALCREDAVVAVGECGLDFNRDFSPRDQQRRAFEWQLAIAADLDMPVFLHERDAHEAFHAMLRAASPSLRAMVVHCFTGSRAEAEAYLDIGAYIGITGWICDERRGRHLAEVVRAIPEDRLLIETDAPFLRPRDLPASPRGERHNEPALLPHIARTIARHRGCTVEELARTTSANATRVFGLE